MSRIFRHFKGGRYEALHTATHTEDGSEYVIYKSLDNGKVWVRPLTMWTEETNRWPDGVTRPRFVLEEALAQELFEKRS